MKQVTNTNWQKLGLADIELSGIHLDLLKRQAVGLTGHIGEVFPDLSDRSAWLGGDGESWERGPYYIDGLIPLAYLLRDASLIKKANHWLDAIISSQEPSGFFGPGQNIDWWPRAVVLKAMVSAHLATGREDILTFLNKYLNYMAENLDDQPFDFWAYARGLEGKEALDLLSVRQSPLPISVLEKKWKDNTLDWGRFFLNFPYRKPTHSYLNRHLFGALKPALAFMDSLEKKRKKSRVPDRKKILAKRSSKSNRLYLTTHGVNLAMALKYLLYCSNDTGPMFAALDTLHRYHGNALYLFSSDEHLNGPDPDAGIELCAVVEMMYSMEEAVRLSGSMRAADLLEYYAYNALLSTITADFTAHQYVQQVNQTDCEARRHHFYDTDRYANTFGVAPNFGCCAANMHQGWPKMMLSAVMKSDDNLAVFLYINGIFRVDFADGHVMLEMKTGYPFADEVVIRCLESTVKTDKTWLLRIPFGSDAVLEREGHETFISGKDELELKGMRQGEELKLRFDFDIVSFTNPDSSLSVRRGPLLYALPIEYEEFYIKGKKPFHDRGFRPKEKKDMSLVLEKGAIRQKDFRQTHDADNFFACQCVLTVAGYDNKEHREIDVKMIPYGMTILRITQFRGRESNE